MRHFVFSALKGVEDDAGVRRETRQPGDHTAESAFHQKESGGNIETSKVDPGEPEEPINFLAESFSGGPNKLVAQKSNWLDF
jgi:hypothetical protein